jgi:hypothetical protein
MWLAAALPAIRATSANHSTASMAAAHRHKTKPTSAIIFGKHLAIHPKRLLSLFLWARAMVVATMILARMSHPTTTTHARNNKAGANVASRGWRDTAAKLALTATGAIKNCKIEMPLGTRDTIKTMNQMKRRLNNHKFVVVDSTSPCQEMKERTNVAQQPITKEA